MSAWRVIITDSESMTGVAPVCARQSDVDGPHAIPGTPWGTDDSGVYDCCPGPHIETWSVPAAAALAALLTAADAELCS
jgi:hypothetical protein